MNDANNIKSIKQIIEWADGKSLIIPNLQRDYVWGKPEWRRLWDDIISVLNKIEDNNLNDENPQHFTGVVTFKEEEDGRYAVLDGQQRLTTIAILLDYLCYVKDPTNEQTASKLSAFKSRVTFDGDPMESIEDKKNKYIEVYSFFMDCHLEINYFKVDELLDIVLNRLFVMVHISAKGENAHDIFEGLNATGKNLEYSDLLLNALLEEAATGEEGKVKGSWEELLKKICGVEEILFENEEGETVEKEKVKDAPLKLKKYFNAINAMTTGESGSIVESVAEFNAILNRLKEFGNNVLGNTVDSSSDKIDTLSKWADVYQMIIDPVGSYDLVKGKEYLKELYYLSLWNTTAYIPTIMRIIYRNVKLESTQEGYYSGVVVKNMLKAILSVVVYTRIILNRVHADDRNVENQIRYMDFIYDANCENKSPEEIDMTSYEYILSIIYGLLPTVAAEIINRADEVIRAYLYTSSGSKFLLALYVDSMHKDTSVFLLEHKGDKAQVEHMVSQNLCDGSFSDYGYDVSSIGLLDNLILLSSKINNRIGDGTPECKCKAWKEDCFGGLFFKKELDNWGGLRESQQAKVQGIIDTFKSYFSITEVHNASSNNNYTFARKDKKNGRTEVLKYEYHNECKTGSSEQQYLVIKDGKYDEVPKSIEKSVISVFYGESCQIKKTKPNDFGGLYGIIKRFIEQIDETNNFYNWLLKCEETIQTPANGSNKVTTPNGKTFTYSQKMIHTDKLHKDEDKCSVIMGRKAVKKTSANGGVEVFEINNCKFALSNDFNNAPVIKQLQTIYSNYDCATKKKFGFWVSITYKIPVFIGNVLIQTNYVNIGDAQIYEEWIKNTTEHGDIFKNTGSDNSPLVSNGEKAVQSYFNCQRLSFGDLIQNGDKIKIPEYQRAYVWDKSNWDVLFQQLINKNEVFLGTVVIRNENDSWYVVDGQQRLSTLTGFYAEIEKDKSLQQKLPSELLMRVKGRGIDSFIKQQKEKPEEINCQFDVIFIDGPKEYQYEVFSSINSAGKKLTEEEKIANFLFAQYPEKDYDEVKDIAYNPGFAKAFCECVTGKFCERTSIYLTLKALVKSNSIAFEQLNNLSRIHRYIKGDAKQDIFNNRKYPIWLSLLNMLEVTTADALLLYWTTCLLEKNSEKSYENFELLTKKICTLYFLLYIMDRSGNAKKSADTNFLNCREIENGKKMASIVVNSQADQPYWNGKEDISSIAEKIWTQYILTLPIYDIGQARIKRFILLMLESMMVNEQYSSQEFEKNVKKQAKFDIEHISPASCPTWMRYVDSPISSSRLNYLENVMILETDINKAVKDKCLSKKICFKKENNTSDDSKSTMASNYSASTSFMTRMVCEMQQDNKKQYYDCEFAAARLKRLQESIQLKLVELLESVLEDSSEGIPGKKFDLGCNLNICAGKKSNPRTKKNQNTASQKKKSTGNDNLIKVVEYTTQFAVEDQTTSTKWDTAFVKKCRAKAIAKIVEELGMENKYKTTITSNITRGLSIKTVDDVDTALLALWKGESNSDLDKILEIIGNKSASLKSNIEKIKEYICRLGMTE